MTASSVSDSRLRRNAKALFEALEPRMLLSVNWAGAWTLNGILNEADTDNNSASFASSALAASATIQDLGGGNYQMDVPRYGKHFALQAVGNELQGHTAGPDTDGEYEDQYIRIVSIDGNAALFFLANGGYPDSTQGQIEWSTGVGGLATRGAAAITARPWVGEYSFSGYNVDVSNFDGVNPGQVTLSSETGTILMADAGGGRYTGEKVGNGDPVTFVPSGKGLLSTQSQTYGDGSVEEERIWLFRGPDDTVYALSGSASFDPTHTRIDNAYHSAYLLTPNAGFEYKPDLAIEILGSAGNVLPGQTVTVPVKITNLGAAPASGKVNLDLWTPASLAGPAGSKLLRIQIAPGASTATTMTFTVPRDTSPAAWDIRASVDTANAVAETDETNNDAQAAGFCNVVWLFGTVGGKSGRKLTLTDPDGTLVTFALTGTGAGTVGTSGGLWQVSLDAATTSSTTVSIATARGGPGDGKTVLASLTAPGALKSISAPTTRLAGPMSLTGAGAGVSITLGDIDGGSIASASPIQSLAASQWLDAADAAYQIDLTTPSIAKIAIAGDFQGDVAVTGNLGSSVIGGGLAGSLWDIGGSVTKIAVAGDAGQSIVRSGLDIASLTLGSSTSSDFGAGVSLDLLKADRHVAVGDAASAPTGTIKSFTIKGDKKTPTVRFFQDSNLSAGIGKLALVNWDGLGGLFTAPGMAGKITHTDLTNAANSWKYPLARGVVNTGPDLFIHVI